MHNFALVCYGALMVAWFLCTVFAYRNFKRAGEPAGVVIVLSILIWPLAFFIFPYSRGLEARRKAAELAAQEALRRRSAEEAQRRDAEAQRLAALDAERQRALTGRLSSILSQSQVSASRIPALVQSAEDSIGHAEAEFQEGAFAPFWDAVERAANQLATLQATLQDLIGKSDMYSRQSVELKIAPPPFEIGLKTLPDVTHLVKRMQGVVRRAQKDINFALIFEQRKTNQILVAGFQSLGHALGELGDRLNDSLERLSGAIGISVAKSTTDIVTSQRKMTAALAAEIDRSRTQAAHESDSRREHERKELDLLDGIKRGT